MDKRKEDLDEEEYKKRLSEKASGGCIETAEAASELREANSGLNRRTFMENSIGGVVGGLSFTQLLGHAEARSEKDQACNVSEINPDVESIKSSQKVASILDEVNISAEYDKSVGYLVEICKGNPETATESRVNRVDSTDRLTIEATITPTAEGELTYMSSSDGRTEALLSFENSSKIPRERFDAPANVGGTLVGHSDSTEYVREASNREISRIRAEIESPPGKVLAFTGQEIDGYQVITPDDEEGAVWKYDVNSNFAIENQSNLTSDVQSSDICDAAGWFCVLCVQGAAICGACASLCFSGVGALACAICLVHTCGITAADCITCVDCLA